MQSEISRRISITRYLMVIGIIVLHMPPYEALSATGPELFSYIKAFFSHGVFRATVPVLTVMSGYLLIRSGLQRFPATLVKKKCRSLLLPLILWNVPLVLAIFLLQRFEVASLSLSTILYPVEWTNWINALLGLTAPPANYPLNFLRDLFVIALLSPIMWQMLKRAPYIGLLVISVIYYFNLEGPLVLRNSMLISFYLGALAAHQQWDLRKLDRFAIPCLVTFVGLCAAIVAFKIENREFLRIVSPVLIWPAMSLLVGTWLGNVLQNHAKHSFFTFLSHAPMILIIWMIYQRFADIIPYPLFWFATPIITAVLAVYLARGFTLVTPKLAAIMLGNR